MGGPGLFREKDSTPRPMKGSGCTSPPQARCRLPDFFQWLSLVSKEGLGSRKRREMEV